MKEIIKINNNTQLLFEFGLLGSIQMDVQTKVYDPEEKQFFWHSYYTKCLRSVFDCPA